jgi:hypothetical protein
VEGAAKLFGQATALKALREGEFHGIGEYEDVLSDPNLDPDCANLIRSQLLPQSRSHIPALDRLIGSQ